MFDFEELYQLWKQDPESLENDELEYLYNKAKDAYYNGEELMPDEEFDTLEVQMGQENKGYIGSKTGNYTIQHSFIMGSLAKVQIKEDKKTGIVNWEESADKLASYLRKAGCNKYETTPKLDGCSFSAEFKNVNNEAVLVSCATRGDGEYGTDISHWFQYEVKGPNWDMIDDAVRELCEKNSNDILCIRGEILVPHDTFNEKYVTFANPRAFVAGCTNKKWEGDQSQTEAARDLRFVCYDYRMVDGDTGKFMELDWIDKSDPTYKYIGKYLGHIGELPDMNFCQVHQFNGRLTVKELQDIYDEYADFRQSSTEYALDGIVFKPNASARKYNDKRKRPEDCVAMKFMPIMSVTTIKNILWKAGKTGEYAPKAVVETIKLDGKNINKVSIHNYNYIMTHNAGIGSVVRVSMAGDIIPYIYEIIEAAGVDNINLPDDTYVYTDPKSGCMHLMKTFTEDSLAQNQFVASAKTLGINFIGPAAAASLWNALHTIIPQEHPELGESLNNVIQLIPSVTHGYIKNTLGTGKSILNIIQSLTEFGQRIELSDIIASFCFKSCGDRASKLCANIIMGKKANTASFPGESYSWAYDAESPQYKAVMSACDYLGFDLTPAEEEEDTSDLIPIIMTGSPKEITNYATKEQFLNAHPQYVETTSWKECKILFTDDLTSTSGKMKKAQKAGVEIRLYED